MHTSLCLIHVQHRSGLFSFQVPGGRWGIQETESREITFLNKLKIKKLRKPDLSSWADGFSPLYGAMLDPRCELVFKWFTPPNAAHFLGMLLYGTNLKQSWFEESTQKNIVYVRHSTVPKLNYTTFLFSWPTRGHIREVYWDFQWIQIDIFRRSDATKS